MVVKSLYFNCTGKALDGIEDGHSGVTLRKDWTEQ
jgi:hypothetical protein